MPQHLQDIVISTVVAAVVGWSLARWREARRMRRDKRRGLNRALLAQLQSIHQAKSSSTTVQLPTHVATLDDALKHRPQPDSVLDTNADAPRRS